MLVSPSEYLLYVFCKISLELLSGIGIRIVAAAAAEMEMMEAQARIWSLLCAS